MNENDVVVTAVTTQGNQLVSILSQFVKLTDTESDISKHLRVGVDDGKKRESGKLTMAEYIEREALYKEVTEKYHDINGGQYPFNVVAYDMAQLVKSAPTADVVEVVHGEWVNYKAVHYKCSICGNRVGGKITKYCSECGAKMGGERRSENENT